MKHLALSRRGLRLAIALALLPTTACDPADSEDTGSSDTDPGSESGQSTGGSETGSDDASTGEPGDCPTLAFEDFEGSPVFPAGCYQVDLLIAKSDGTVTFEAGAEVTFGPNAGLNIFGEAALAALGTAEAPVVFTGALEERGSWQGLGISSRSADNQLTHLQLSDAGGSGAALELVNARIALDAVTIENNAGFGLVADAESDMSMTDSVITANEQLMRVAIESVETVDDSNSLVGNDEDILHAEGSGLDDAVWTVTDVPVYPQTDVFVDGSWTLMAGVTVAMRQDAEIRVRSTASITAEGTADAPVTLTGQNAEPGYWKGLTVESTSADNVLSNARLEYGGSSPWTGDSSSPALVFLENGGRLTIEDSVLAHSASAALRARSGADIEGFAGNSIEHNAETLEVQVDLVSDIDPSNAFVDNDEAFVRVQRPNAPNNHLITPQRWGALEIPYRITYRVSIEAPLVVEAGAVLEFDQGEWIEVVDDGTFRAEGTADAPVTFEGAEALSGYWKGLNFQTISAENVLENVLIRHAGESQWDGFDDSYATIFLGGYQEGRVHLIDSTLTENDGNALYVRDEGSHVECTNVSIDVDAPWMVAIGNGTTNCI